MISFPFTSIEGCEGKPVPVVQTNHGWHLAAPAGLTARIKAMRDGRICRIAPSADREVVQFVCGDATSRLCDALYSPAVDLLLRFAGADLQLTRDGRAGFVVSTAGPLEVTAEQGFIAAYWGAGTRLPVLREQAGAPAGWASTPAYGATATEADILATADWLRAHLLRFGCEWVEIGEGWQSEEQPAGRRAGVRASPTRFANGMPALADALRERGLRPALRCLPFGLGAPDASHAPPWLWVDKAMAAQGRASFLDTALDGAPHPGAPHPGGPHPGGPHPGAIVDATSPNAGPHFRELARFLCRDWGFEGLRLAGLERVMALYVRHQAMLCEPEVTPQHALRRALHLLRLGAGPDARFQVDAPRPYAVGLAQSADTGACPSTLNGDFASAAELDAVFLNRTCFWTQPPALRLADALWAQARLHASFLALTGQALTLGDRLPELPEDRVELLRRILPVADIRPMDFFPLGDAPRPPIVVLHVAHHWIGAWTVVAFCNWGAQETTFDVTPERLGLPGGPRICLDAWTGELLAVGAAIPPVQVAAQAVRVLSCWPALDRPQFVGSSRHLTQGAVEVESARWEERRLTLRGESTTVHGDPYTVRIYVPPGYRVVAPEVTQRGPLIELTYPRPYDGRVAWWVRFARV